MTVAEDVMEPTFPWKMLAFVFAILLAVLIVMFMLFIVGAKSDQKLDRWRNRENDEPDE